MKKTFFKFSLTVLCVMMVLSACAPKPTPTATPAPATEQPTAEADHRGRRYGTLLRRGQRGRGG